MRGASPQQPTYF